MKRLLTIALVAAQLLVPVLATAAGTSSSPGPSRQSAASALKVTFQTRFVPSIVDINIRAGNAAARGAVPQNALVAAVAGHAAARVMERANTWRAERAPKSAPSAPRSAPTSAFAAARWNAHHVSTLVPKNAGMQPRTSPKGRSESGTRARRH